MGSDTSAINIADSQSMLSQRLAKEAVMVSQGIEQQSVVEKTIFLFEQSHAHLINADNRRNLEAVHDEEVLKQLSHVEKLWVEYKKNIQSYIAQPTVKSLSRINDQSLIVLKGMDKASCNDDCIS